MPTMEGSLSIKKTSGHTGRSGQVLLDNKPTAHTPIQSFVQELCSTHKKPDWWLILLTRPLAWKLLWELAKASSTGLSGTWYRSQRFPKDDSHPKTADLGPPPPGRQGEGRYTEGKPIALYLSRSIDTAALECPEKPNKPRVFVQEFHISFPAAKVVRLGLDLEAKAPHLHHALLESEYLPQESEFVPVPYRATQFLAFLCRLVPVDAIEYPSVRAGYRENPEAVNLVVLGPAVNTVAEMVNGEPFEYQGST